MKKLSAILLAFTLVFSSVGTTIFFANDAQSVEAKGYKSGKKGFNSNNNSTNIQKNNNDATNPTTTKQNNNTTKKNDSNTASPNKGGLMKGLMLGGLAGLLFGSLFAGMGMLGNILGLLINVAAIAAIIFFLVKIYQVIKRKKDKEVTDTWKN